MSEDVRNEVNCAFERFRRHEDITLLPFQVDESSLSDAILYYLGRIHIMDGGIPPEMLRLKDLIGRISVILEKESIKTSSVTEQITGQRKQYGIIGSMIYADNSFVGRRK